MERGLATRPLARFGWRVAAFLALGLGGLGVIVPGLPTVPFILLASWCAIRGSPRLHRWLRDHRRFGPMIRDWEAHGAVSRRAKRLALMMMAAASGVMLASPAPLWAWALGTATMLVVATWLWRRPEPAPAAPSPALHADPRVPQADPLEVLVAPPEGVAGHRRALPSDPRPPSEPGDPDSKGVI